jgi:hypothetical protein
LANELQSTVIEERKEEEKGIYRVAPEFLASLPLKLINFFISFSKIFLDPFSKSVSSPLALSPFLASNSSSPLSHFTPEFHSL